MKIKVIAKVIYEFEMETESNKRSEINSEAEDRWDEIVNMILEEEYYQGTDINFEEI